MPQTCLLHSVHFSNFLGELEKFLLVILYDLQDLSHSWQKDYGQCHHGQEGFETVTASFRLQEAVQQGLVSSDQSNLKEIDIRSLSFFLYGLSEVSQKI